MKPPTTLIRFREAAKQASRAAMLLRQGMDMSTKLEQKYGEENYVGVNQYKIAALGTTLYTSNIKYCSALVLRSMELNLHALSHIESCVSEPQKYQEPIERLLCEMDSRDLELFLFYRLYTPESRSTLKNESFKNLNIVREIIESNGLRVKTENMANKFFVSNGKVFGSPSMIETLLSR